MPIQQFDTVFENKLTQVLQQPKHNVVLQSEQRLQNIRQMFDLIKNSGPGDNYNVYDQLEALLVLDPQLARQENYIEEDGLDKNGKGITKIDSERLISRAIEYKQEILVELLLRYGAQIRTQPHHVSAVVADETFECHVDAIKALIGKGYDYSMVAKMITAATVGSPISHTGSNVVWWLLSRNLRAKYHLLDRNDLDVENEEVQPIVRQVHVAAKAFSPYYRQLRTYYAERGAFLGVCKSTHTEASKIHARRLPDKEGTGPLPVIFSFLKPRKQSFVDAARVALDAEIASAPDTPRYVIV